MFWDERGGGLAPMDPHVDTATIRTVLSTHRVDWESFSSRCCALRRTHTSADPIRLLCIRVALPLTLSLPSRFSPSARHTVGGTTRALWLVGDFSCDCVFWKKRGGGLTRQRVGLPVSAATITTVMSADPIRALCTRLALLFILSLPSRLVPSVRLTVGVPPRAL